MSMLCTRLWWRSGFEYFWWKKFFVCRDCKGSWWETEIHWFGQTQEYRNIQQDFQFWRLCVLNMILEEIRSRKERYEMKTMKELKVKMKMFPYLYILLLGNQIILFDSTNDTTSAVGLALIPVGNCTWRCYTRSVTEQSPNTWNQACFRHFTAFLHCNDYSSSNWPRKETSHSWFLIRRVSSISWLCLTKSMVIFYGMCLKPICKIQIVLVWTTRMLMTNWKLWGERKRKRKNLLIQKHLANPFLHNLH